MLSKKIVLKTNKNKESDALTIHDTIIMSRYPSVYPAIAVALIY